MRLLLASGNPGKRAELTDLLAPLGVEVLAPADIGELPDVVEDGETFEANAAKKAVSGALSSGEWTLGDDSGLCVDALDGAPGVRSARFAGTDGDVPANNAKLLRELDGVPIERRDAHFVCVLVLANPAGEVVLEVRGEAHGRILDAPRGGEGFGYDPLFLFDEEGEPGQGRSFAELTRPEKSPISHRGRALAELVRHMAVAG